MNENLKTLTFVALAVAAVVVAALTGPSSHVASTDDMRNQPLFPEFTKPLDVTSLEVVEFDDQRSEVHPFQVAQTEFNGKAGWSIPSHNNYRTDAKDQMAAAIASLTGLKVIEMVSDNQGDRRVYGVVEPDMKNLKAGDTGVGKKVVMRDKDGKALLSLVIGNEVPNRPGLRYVRIADQSPIYTIQVKTDKLSTKFEDWIERNLLQINTIDIQRLWIRDYSVDQIHQALVQRGETVIEYNDTSKPAWKLVENKILTTKKDKPDEIEWVAMPLSADEELNVAKLDELKTALDDLKIVDVRRKPAGLSAGLKAAADFTRDKEAGMSLSQKGFFLTPLEANGPVELVSNEGEIRIVMKDGVEYILRFGDIAGSGAAKKESDAEKGGGVNRYLFVSAQFDPDTIPKPKLEPLPEPKSDEKKADEKAAPEEKADKQADETKQPETKPAGDAERQRIEKENQRKQDAYEQAIANGKKHVSELNARFADWYYIISDDIFRKIHLGHDELFTKKGAATDEDEHAGHQHGDATEEPTPSEMLENMKNAGPAGE